MREYVSCTRSSTSTNVGNRRRRNARNSPSCGRICSLNQRAPSVGSNRHGTANEIERAVGGFNGEGDRGPASAQPPPTRADFYLRAAHPSFEIAPLRRSAENMTAQRQSSTAPRAVTPELPPAIFIWETVRRPARRGFSPRARSGSRARTARGWRSVLFPRPSRAARFLSPPANASPRPSP